MVYVEGFGVCESQNSGCLPPYNENHVYRYVIDISSSPTVLNFSFGDSGLSDNSGQYDIKVTPLTALPECNENAWQCNDWTECNSTEMQTRECSKLYECAGDFSEPSVTQTCEYIPPICASWSYTPWNECSQNGERTRSIVSAYPTSCESGSPILNESCVYVPPICTSWTYSDWSACAENGQQARDVISSYPNYCSSGEPELNRSCVYTPECTEDIWHCGNWDTCSSSGIQNRSCEIVNECSSINTPPPAISQSCSYVPSCAEDTWECGDWGACSPQGTQARSCSKSYNCPNTETAIPSTSQYCTPLNSPALQTPSEDLEVGNQNLIVKSTVKLICPVSRTMASQGSGTIIDPQGTILTNFHVIDGTPGCIVGFVSHYSDEPYFGERHIADVVKTSKNLDTALLKIRNPYNKKLSNVDITASDSDDLNLGDKITTYGYPGKFGTKITYTSGDFSGTDDNYLKTTAIIEHGNSGGGAYLKNGTYIGIPTAVKSGKLNSMGLIVSINMINKWLGNTTIAHDNSSNNNFSRVSSILEDIDLNTLTSLNLYIAGKDVNDSANSSSNIAISTGQKTIQEEKKQITKIDKKLSKRMKGNILLQVEKNGEGWYVNPDDEKKYYLGRPTDAFGLMRNLGLGIKHSELEKYLNSKFPARLSGKILLDVERNGEAYYINPSNLKGYFLNRPSDAFKVMRELGLGITNDNIRKIDVGEIEN